MITNCKMENFSGTLGVIYRVIRHNKASFIDKSRRPCRKNAINIWRPVDG